MKVIIILFFFVCNFVSYSQVTLTHSIGEVDYELGSWFCSMGGFSHNKYARVFVLSEFGIGTNDNFSIYSCDVAFHNVESVSEFKVNIYKIDSNFPESFDQSDIIGSSETKYLTNSDSQSIVSFNFESPLLINDSEIILVEAEFPLNENRGTFMAITAEDNDFSWYKSEVCEQFQIYNSEWTIGNNTRYYITATGDFNLSISENDLNNLIQITPNPTNNITKVKLNNSILLYEIIIFDHVGKVVLKPELIDNKIYLNGLSSGVYQLMIKTNKGIIHKKIIKN